MLAVGAGGFLLTFFFSRLSFRVLSPPLWEKARYKLKYCLEELVGSKQIKIIINTIKH